MKNNKPIDLPCYSDIHKKISDLIINSDYGIENGDKIKIASLVEPTIGIKTKSLEDENIPLGQSKIGGKPDIPTNFEWPRFNGEPLTFCAQYNCKGLSEYDYKKILPDSGYFYVFIYIDQEWPGFYNADDSYKVIYSSTEENLVRTDFPEDYFKEGIIKSAGIEYFEYHTLPSTGSHKLDTITEKYSDFYLTRHELDDLIDKVCGIETDNFHQFLGEDRALQSNVSGYLAENELKINSQEEFNSKRQKIKELAKSYEILFQLDCGDRKTNLNEFGGSSVIYFGIYRNDLKNKNFKNIKMVFQST